ncbi:MAG: hypothetical protein JSS02_14120 [Planctomycetes bacterium]|nr:hypothetical protein [Planctomycetota bacterium]
MAKRMTLTPLGALVGGLLGAVIRPLTVYLYAGHVLSGSESNVILGISAGLGFLVGMISGAFTRPVIGVTLGGLGAITTYGVTVVPLTFCFCLTSLNHGFQGDPPPLWLITLTGMICGCCGGLVELLTGRSQPGSPSAESVGQQTSNNSSESV